eukprot:11763834-Alexandrium_andersonii.AAC.1
MSFSFSGTTARPFALALLALGAFAFTLASRAAARRPGMGTRRTMRIVAVGKVHELRAVARV